MLLAKQRGMYRCLGLAVLCAVTGCGSSSNDENASPDGGTSTGGGAGSGGVSSGGGSGGSSGSGGSGGKNDGGPPPVVSDCSGLAPVGTWEDITPPDVKAGAGSEGGTFAIAVDPVNQGTMYAGTLHQKVWKTTDCGATWSDIATGTNGDNVNSGMNWTFAVDPQEPEVVYTNSGYGANGLFKSKNGGVDWEEVWPPAGQPELGAAFTYNFANVIAIDPNDHLHVLLTFHEACLPPHTATCIAETMDAGASWKLIDGEPSWNGNEGQVIFFLENSTTWLWGSQTNGFWRGTNSGESWEAIDGFTTSHLQGSQLHRAQDGTFYVAGSDGVWFSPDGTVPTWKKIENTGPIVGGLVGDGTTMYTSTCYFPDFCDKAKYLKAEESAGETWVEMPGPDVPMGGTMGFDPGHQLLYSSNLQSGLWRVVVK